MTLPSPNVNKANALPLRMVRHENVMLKRLVGRWRIVLRPRVKVLTTMMSYRLFVSVQLACPFPRLSYTSSSIYLHSFTLSSTSPVKLATILLF